MMTTMMMMILSLFEPAHPHTDEGYSQKDESRIDINEDDDDDEGPPDLTYFPYMDPGRWTNLPNIWDMEMTKLMF